MEIRSQANELFPGAVMLSNGNQVYVVDGREDAKKLLQLDLGKGKMLMGYSAEGAPVPLPDDIPTFWVTAPTSVSTGIGVIVNADWAIDSLVNKGVISKAEWNNNLSRWEIMKMLYASI